MSTLETPRPQAASGPAGARAVDVPDAPPPSARARITARALVAALRHFRGDLRLVLPDGRTVRSRDATDTGPRMRIHREAFFRRCAVEGKVGFGEGYMAGDWSADDLPGVLGVWATNLDRLPTWTQRLAHLSARGRQPATDANTPGGARRNIRAHYDLSNALFATFLDASMTYSAAVFRPGDTLEQAQDRKRRLLLDSLELAPQHHLLEIGTGWGSLAVQAARDYGCRVTSVTLSQEQASYARDLIRRAGLADRVEVEVRDYRAVTGTYDRIVSVEMLEAVGEQFWGVFFEQLAARLAPGGRIALQTITFPHRRYRVARGGYGWIHKYVFPGGEIPSLEALGRPLREAGLEVRSRREIGPHYARTLREWRQRFLAHGDRVAELGFDDTFVRLWEFYLAYCEAGFAVGALGDAQLLLTHAEAR